MEDTPEYLSKSYYKNEYHVQHKLHPNNYFMYGYIKALRPNSVFEFGCNAGRHLNQLSRMGINVAGVDINKNAIEAGRRIYGLSNIRHGGEELIRNLGNYDIIITNSVLCHVPEAKEIVRELREHCNKMLIFEAPYKTSGKYWYTHEYEKMGFKEVWSWYAESLSTVYVLYESI